LAIRGESRRPMFNLQRNLRLTEQILIFSHSLFFPCKGSRLGPCSFSLFVCLIMRENNVHRVLSSLPPIDDYVLPHLPPLFTSFTRCVVCSFHAGSHYFQVALELFRFCSPSQPLRFNHLSTLSASSHAGTALVLSPSAPVPPLSGLRRGGAFLHTFFFFLVLPNRPNGRLNDYPCRTCVRSLSVTVAPLRWFGNRPALHFFRS